MALVGLLAGLSALATAAYVWLQMRGANEILGELQSQSLDLARRIHLLENGEPAQTPQIKDVDKKEGRK